MSVLLPKKIEDSSSESRTKGSEQVALCTKTEQAKSPPHGITAWRFVLAFCVAVAADTVGLLFGEALVVVFDVVVALILLFVLGFNWILIPALLAEAIPGVGLFPTWALAVLAVAGLNTFNTKKDN